MARVCTNSVPRRAVTDTPVTRLFGAVVSTLLSRVFGFLGLVALFSTQFHETPFLARELWLFAALGVLCGLIAAAFVWTLGWWLRLKRSWPLYRRYLGFSAYAETLAVVAVVAAISFPLRALRNQQQDELNALFVGADLPRHWHTPGPIFNLFFFCIVKFVLTILSVTLPLAAGLFIPVFVMGAGVGRFFGEIVKIWHPAALAGGYAVVGAAALSAGTTRAVSTSIIVIELTGQVQHILPVLLCVLIASAVTRALDVPTMYELLFSMHHTAASFKTAAGGGGVLVNGEFRQGGKTLSSVAVSAAEVMTREIRFFTLDSTIGDAERLLDECAHDVFPLVLSAEQMYLIGSVRRSALKSTFRAVVRSDTDFRAQRIAWRVMSPDDRGGSKRSSLLVDPGAHVMAAEQRISDVEVIVEPSSVSVTPQTVLTDVRFLLTLMDVPLLYVLSKGELVGILAPLDVAT